jgi:hypothetical protein
MTQQPARRRQHTGRCETFVRLLCFLSLPLFLLTYASISAEEATNNRLEADKRLLAGEPATVVALFNGAHLFTASRLQSRVQRWDTLWRLRPLFSRSHAFKRFVRKTQKHRETLVMNAGLAFFDTNISRFTHSVASLTPRTQIVMAFRASLTEWGPSDLALTKLDAHWQPISGAGIILAIAHRIGNGWYGPPWREDPRLVPTERGLAVAYTLSCAFERNRHGFQVWQRQGLAFIDDKNGALSDDIFFSIGNNHDFKSTIYPSLEKNWQFFEHSGVLHVVYSTQPFCVYRATDWTRRSIEKVGCRQWHYNTELVDLRGSTPPVRVGDSFFMFAHSPTYEVHAISFSAERLEISAVSKVPLLNLQPKRPFVCGAVYVADASTWYLSMGIDDVSIAVYRLKHSTVAMNLLPVQPVTSTS